MVKVLDPKDDRHCMMCLHNCGCDSKLCHEHFDKLDNDEYVQTSLPFTSANALYH